MPLRREGAPAAWVILFSRISGSGSLALFSHQGIGETRRRGVFPLARQFARAWIPVFGQADTHPVLILDFARFALPKK